MPKSMPEIIVIAHNIRSTHNIGAIFRTAEGFGINEIIISGYTPFPICGGANNPQKETRLPHIADKLTKQIHKTALGAETMVSFTVTEQPDFSALRARGFTIVGLEQVATSHMLNDYTAPHKIALLLGEEVDGIAEGLLDECDETIEIPMRGKKESFNVSVATGIALYGLLFSNTQPHP